MLEIMDGADSGQQQGGQDAMLEHFGNGPDPLPIGMRAEPIIEARTRKSVTVGNLDGVHLGPIKCPGDRLDVLDAVLMANGMHSVAQRHVLDVKFRGFRIQAHGETSSSSRSAIFSAVRSAAEVMMSKLPA